MKPPNGAVVSGVTNVADQLTNALGAAMASLATAAKQATASVEEFGGALGTFTQDITPIEYGNLYDDFTETDYTGFDLRTDLAVVTPCASEPGAPQPGAPHPGRPPAVRAIALTGGV